MWVLSFFIFRFNKLFFNSFVLLISSFFLLNIYATINLQNEFNNSTSFEHSVADESITHTEEIVDFLASYVEMKYQFTMVLLNLSMIGPIILMKSIIQVPITDIFIA